MTEKRNSRQQVSLNFGNLSMPMCYITATILEIEKRNSGQQCMLSAFWGCSQNTFILIGILIPISISCRADRSASTIDTFSCGAMLQQIWQHHWHSWHTCQHSKHGKMAKNVLIVWLFLKFCQILGWKSFKLGSRTHHMVPPDLPAP